MSRAPETAAQAREQIAATEAYLAEAEARVRTLTARRRAALVDGSTRDVLEAEDEARAAQVDADRARLRLEGLQERLRVAERAERGAAEAAKRAELVEVARTRLRAAARVDAAIAELDAAVRDWERLGREVARRWVVDGHADKHGVLMPEYIHPLSPVRGAVPPTLSLALEMLRPVNMAAAIHGPRPVERTDPANRVVALLEAPSPPPVAREPEPSGVTLVIGEPPPSRPPDPPPPRRAIDVSRPVWRV